MMTALITLILVAMFAAIAGFTLFAATYAHKADWRRTAAGRALMYLVVSIDMALLLTVANTFFSPYPGQLIVSLLAFTGMAFVAWHLVRVLYSTQGWDFWYPARVVGRKIKALFTREKVK